MAEPGRGMVGDAGVIAAEVLLVSRKSSAATCTAGSTWTSASSRAWPKPSTRRSAISSSRPRDGDATGPCVLAGPSCDSADVLYEKRPVMLPVTLKAGDRVIIRNTGAYTSSYSSVGFQRLPAAGCRRHLRRIHTIGNIWPGPGVTSGPNRVPEAREMEWTCRCGAFAAEVDIKRGHPRRLLLRELSEAFARADRSATDALDEAGGSDLFQVAPEEVRFLRGGEVTGMDKD